MRENDRRKNKKIAGEKFMLKILFYDTKNYDKDSFEKRRKDYPEIEMEYIESELSPKSIESDISSLLNIAVSILHVGILEILTYKVSVVESPDLLLL